MDGVAGEIFMDGVVFSGSHTMLQHTSQKLFVDLILTVKIANINSSKYTYIYIYILTMYIA